VGAPGGKIDQRLRDITPTGLDLNLRDAELARAGFRLSQRMTGQGFQQVAGAGSAARQLPHLFSQETISNGYNQEIAGERVGEFRRQVDRAARATGSVSRHHDARHEITSVLQDHSAGDGPLGNDLAQAGSRNRRVTRKV
jgi:hypothetical protein